MLLLVCFEGIARLSRRVWRRFVRGSREISLVPSLHRASTDALIRLIRLGAKARLGRFGKPLGKRTWHGAGIDKPPTLSISRKKDSIFNRINP